MPGEGIRVEGLQDLRKALKAVDAGGLKEIQRATKRAAEIVATQARVNAPKRSGRLAGSIRASTSGAKGVVRSRLPYAAVHEYGGTIRPHGGVITIKRSEFVGRAIDDKTDEVLDELATGYDDVLRRGGWA